MLTLHIDSEVQDSEDENVFITKHGKLTFVDLAGKSVTWIFFKGTQHAAQWSYGSKISKMN